MTDTCSVLEGIAEVLRLEDTGHLGELVGGSSLTMLLLGITLSLRRQRTAAITFLILAIASFVWLLILAFAPSVARWRWLLGSIPPMIILQHAVLLYVIRRPVLPGGKEEMRAALADEDPEFLDKALFQIQATTGRYFSLEALALRYLVPAIFTAALSFGLANALSDASSSGIDSEAIRIGARYGLVGSYTFVLLNLGQRAFRNDITVGSAIWCPVTLAAGTVLAGTLAHLQPAVAESASAEHPSFVASALFFVAGFSPRLAVDLIQSIAQKFYLPQSNPQGLPARILPINQVLGVTPGIQDRLAEEGIEDATALAMADPLRLLRNTNFDKRQILNWIDRALLMNALPDDWLALEKAGITGAIDLAWYTASDEPATDRPPDTAPANVELTRLAELTKIDVSILQQVSERLAQDAQVRLVWALYQLQTEPIPVAQAMQATA